MGSLHWYTVALLIAVLAVNGNASHNRQLQRNGIVLNHNRSETIRTASAMLSLRTPPRASARPNTALRATPCNSRRECFDECCVADELRRDFLGRELCAVWRGAGRAHCACVFNRGSQARQLRAIRRAAHAQAAGAPCSPQQAASRPRVCIEQCKNAVIRMAAMRLRASVGVQQWLLRLVSLHYTV